MALKFRENSRDPTVYTEDGIAVYKIFISFVPKEASLKEVLSHFRVFGDLLKVQMWMGRNSLQNGTISFGDPLGPAKVLRRKYHTIWPYDGQILARPCDSWDQPAVKAANSKMLQNYKALNGKRTLLWLIDDCLVEICKYLQLPDLLYLALAHSRFAAPVQMSGKYKYKHFDRGLLDKLTLWQTREFFRLFGSTMETITGITPPKRQYRIVEFMKKWCTNVKCLHWEFDRMPTNLPQRMPHLTELYLESEDLEDSVIHVVARFKKLNTLSFSMNPEMKGKKKKPT